jgi:hypothetical protein
MSIGPSMRWIGSPDPDEKSGQATYFYHEDEQIFTVHLPDFTTAFMLDQFIQSVYQGGKIEGAKIVQFAVQNAMKEVVK